MKLQAYLQRESISPSQFAQRLGRPASTITRLIKGEREPSMGLLRDIADATSGEVQPNDFLQEVQCRSHGTAA